MEDNKVRSCIGCRHYFVTWEPKTPKGCKFFGFKSIQMPCLMVRKTTGQDCQEYSAKGKEV